MQGFFVQKKYFKIVNILYYLWFNVQGLPQGWTVVCPAWSGG
jgi:uncharacterized protein YbdZ (MbtH family)